MEAAVAGTPCVVAPATNEQRGIARRVRPVEGFDVADTPAGIVRAVDALPTPTATPNGIAAIAERVVDDLAATGRVSTRTAAD
jgi:hypothetical protein